MTSRLYIAFWIAIYALVLLLAFQIDNIHFQPPENAFEINSASFLDFSDAGAAVTRELPDNWQWHGENTLVGQYQIWFEADEHEGNEVWAIVIPTLLNNISASLNGKFIGDGGSMTEPIASNTRYPLIFTFASSLLKPDKNYLEIDIAASTTDKGFLDKIYLGRYADLKPAYERHFFFRIALVKSITYSLVGMALVMLMLALLRPKNKEYAWFALSALLWAAHNATYCFINVIWSNHLWDWFSFASLGWFALVTPIVLFRFRGDNKPKIERSIYILALVLPSIMFLLPQDHMHWVADYVWNPLALGVGGAALILVFINAWKTQDIEYQLLTMSGIVIIPYAIHDLLIAHAILPWNDGYYLQFAAVILLLVFALILLYRLVRFNNQAELLNADLELQVMEKNNQFKQAMQRNRELEKNEWLSAERARITRDMHDGVAGQIISTITSLERGKVSHDEIRNQLEYCINDIRLMIDSMDNDDNDLLSLLAMFRYRIQPTLEHAGIKLIWKPLSATARIKLTPTSSLHVLRILQEGVQNAIRHSKCDSLTIEASVHKTIHKKENLVTIEVLDNGIGFSLSEETSQTPQKRGLRNLYFRAQEINAELDINSNKNGTTLILTLNPD